MRISDWSSDVCSSDLRVARRPGGRSPWWAPPQVLDSQAGASLAALASLSVIGGYLGTLITQTLTYAADEFGVGERSQSHTFAAVRIGVFLSIAISAWADRHGRRRALPLTAAEGGSPHVLTPVTNSQLVYRLILETKPQ